MSKKRGNKKGQTLEDDLDEPVPAPVTKGSKAKAIKKGKKGKKDEWSDEESEPNSKYLTDLRLKFHNILIM